MGQTYTAQEFIKAIPGSGAIIQTIANRVGCDWHTAKKWIMQHPTIKRAYDSERESLIDLAEGILIHNLRVARQTQIDDGSAYEAGDAKWYLARKGKDRGYTERTESQGETRIVIEVVYEEKQIPSPTMGHDEAP